MRRLSWVCVLAAAAVLRFYAIASAHVTLVSSNPAANSRVAESPEHFRLEFSEPLEASVAKASLVHPDGKSTAIAVTSDPRNAYVLLAPAPDLAAGTYRLVWHVLSEDGHPVTGTFVFTVGDVVGVPPPIPAELDAPASWGPTIGGAPAVPAVFRGVGVGALAALAGLLFFLIKFPAASAAADAPSAKVATSLAIAAPVLLIAHLGAWLINAAPNHQLTGAWVSSAFGSDVGRGELWRTLLALPPVWALLLMRRQNVALGLAVVGLLASAAVGHSAAFSPAWSIPLKAVHLLALAAWLGGLLWLVMRDRSDVRSFTADTGRVSSMALIAVLAIAATGVAQSLLILPSLSDIDTAYGVGSLLKVAGLGVLVAFGAYHRFRVMPRLAAADGAPAAATLGASLRREVAVLWLVVVVGGFLAYVSPPPKPTEHQHHITTESEQ